ncbi:MAG: tetratricopeptide repeat protein [Acidobacteriota bacterium]
MCRLAAALLVLALLASPAAAQIDPGTALLEKAGWDALGAGNPRSAAEAFRAAIAADAKNARLHLGAGAAAYLERRDEDATRALDRALALDPRLADARTLLGEIRYRSGDLAGAIGVYERIVADAPDDERHRETLARWRREAELHDRLRQSLNDRFTVSFEGPAEAPLAAQALESLDRAYWRIGQDLSTYPTRPISVVLYTAEQFRDITRSPAWAAGAYDGTIRVPLRGALENPAELDRVLAHEFTHALIHTIAARNVPTWLNEGMAAAFESADVEWARERAHGTPAQMPLELLRTSFGRLSGSQAQLAYATSALAARQLLDEAGGLGVANLLRDLGAGVEFDAAFAHRLQRTFTDWIASRVP